MHLKKRVYSGNIISLFSLTLFTGYDTMFTGIIAEIGTVISIHPSHQGKKMIMLAPNITPQLRLGDSVAINGACQTVTHFTDTTFEVMIGAVTLQKTNLGSFLPQQKVNLELALTLRDRLGGHLVSGHVNAVAPIHSMTPKGETTLITIKTPPHLRPYFIQEGSITLDGISLTIAELKDDLVTVAIIPHTLHHTTLLLKKVGELLNVEVDILAKYVESLLKYGHMASTREPSAETEDQQKRWWQLLQQ